MNKQYHQQENQDSADIGTWIVYGLMFGTLLGIVLNNLVLGMIFGITGGIIFGSLKSMKEK
jgi:hypothetical protein